MVYSPHTVFAFAFLWGILTSEAKPQKTENLLVDKALGTLSQNLQVVALPPTSIPLRINVEYGKITLLNGFVSGFKNIHRTGDVQIQYGNPIRFTVPLQISDVAVGYTVSIRAFYIIQLSPKASIHIARVPIIMQASQDLKTGQTSVDFLEIDGISDIDVRISGLGFFGSLAELLAEALLNSVKEQIIGAVEKTLAAQLTQSLSNLRTPNSVLALLG